MTADSSVWSTLWQGTDVSNWFIGGYGADMNGSAPGIVQLQSRDDGSLAPVDGFSLPFVSPSFLATTGDTLYAALEGEGKIVAVDLATHTETGRSASGGIWPCHIGIYGDTIVVANYFDGALGVLQREPLALGTALGSTGSGPTPAQDGPHAHASIEIEPGVIISADLGADLLLVHTLADGELVRTGSFALPAGTGPRDLALHPSGLLYVLGEHSRTLLALDWRSGELHFVDSIAVPGAVPTDQGAGLVISEAGFIYTLLRGSNLISVIGASEDGRELSAIGSVSSEGDWPRHLALDGRVLHVANQQSGSIASFALDDDGLPALIAPPTAVASPTYLLKG